MEWISGRNIAISSLVSRRFLNHIWLGRLVWGVLTECVISFIELLREQNFTNIFPNISSFLKTGSWRGWWWRRRRWGWWWWRSWSEVPRDIWEKDSASKINYLPKNWHVPWKIVFGKLFSFFFWTDPFRGDMLVCRGVALVTRTKGRMKSNEMEWYTTPNLNLWYNLASPKKSMVSLVPLSVEIMNSRYFKLKSLILSSERRPGLGWASNWSPPNHSLGWGDASSVVITRIIT